MTEELLSEEILRHILEWHLPFDIFKKEAQNHSLRLWHWFTWFLFHYVYLAFKPLKFCLLQSHLKFKQNYGTHRFYFPIWSMKENWSVTNSRQTETDTSLRAPATVRTTWAPPTRSWQAGKYHYTLSLYFLCFYLDMYHWLCLMTSILIQSIFSCASCSVLSLLIFPTSKDKYYVYSFTIFMCLTCVHHMFMKSQK